MDNLLDLYTDYLQVSLGLATATGLSNLVDNQVSHDQVTRMLANNDFTNKDLWLKVKPLIRQHENEDACLIFDDSILDKPHTDESDVVCWHFDHTEGRSVKGINLLTAFYHTQSQDMPLRVPISFEIIEKYKCCDIETKKEQRKSSVTKNELMRKMIDQAIKNQVKFSYVLADAWFASTETMEYIDNKKKYFIFDLKVNRLAIIGNRNNSNWQRIDQLPLQPHVPTMVWLKDLDRKVLLIKQVFTNKDSSVGTRYLVSNNLNLTSADFKYLYQKRWSVEEYHKSLKQNTCVTKSPTRTVKTQCNHVFASIIAYIKLEQYKFSTKLNHFALKTKLYARAAKAAFLELAQIKLQYENFKKFSVTA